MRKKIETKLSFSPKLTGGGEVENKNLSAAVSVIAPSQKSAPIPASCEGLEVSEPVLQTVTRLRMGLGLGESIIAVTGIEPADGASRLAAHMALALARIERSPVLLVDGNVRAPEFHTTFNTQQTPGLCELLEGELELADTVHESDVPFFNVLTSGRASSLAVTLFSSSKCQHTFEAFRNRFRYVVVAVGPLSRASEGMALASMADGLVLALANGERRRRELLQVKREVAGMKTRLLGAVLTETR
jgi:capsular exopolysaccharide synthesis family protein